MDKCPMCQLQTIYCSSSTMDNDIIGPDKLGYKRTRTVRLCCVCDWQDIIDTSYNVAEEQASIEELDKVY
jgi:hypothetical protein